MNTQVVKRALSSFALLVLAAQSADAAEKGGLLVEVSKKTLARDDSRSSINSAGSREISREMTLKMDVKNTSMKVSPEGTVKVTLLIRRWATGEVGSVERSEASAKLEALPPARSAVLDIGHFHVGGHMHGSSDHHVDKLVAWKASIVRGAETVEIASGSDFDSLVKNAKKK